MRLRFSNAFKSGLALMAGCLASASLAQGTTTPPGGALDQLQGSFLENRGQFDSRVRFVANQPGLTYWVTRDGLMVELYKIRKKAGVPSLQAKQGDPSDFENYEKVGQAVSIKFEGANSNAIAQGADQQKPVVDFLTSDTPVRGVKTFSESYIKDLYPGISMRNYQSGTALRYDLIVAPNADPNQIQMNITGADSYKVDADGSLTIKTQVGDLKNSSPLVYQVIGAKQVQVPATFKIANGKVGFQLGKYDKRFPLVIDPLVYGTYMGSNSIPFFSSGAEVMAAGTADVKGNLYMTGSTTSITFPINAGPFNISLAGGQDAFIARISVDAYSLDYCAFIGSAGTDAGLGIALSPNGYLWVGGTTNSAAFPGRINAFTGPTADIFLTRFQVDPVTSAITPNFSRYISQAGDVTNAVTRWSDLDVLPDGSPVVAGTSTNANLIAKGFAPFIFGTSGGSRDGFLMVFEPGSSLVAARWVGGTASDTLGQIGVNASGKIAVTGTVSFSGNQDTSIAPVPGFPTTAGVFPGGRLLRQADAFVVSMNSDLTTNFSAILGAADNDSAVAAAIDAGGNIYVTGKPGALNFPRTPGAFDEDLPGDSFLTKISANGSTVVYSTGLGHNGNVTPTTVKVDVRGVAVVGGVVSWVPTGNPAPTQPGSIPTTPDAIDGVYAGGNENADGAGNPPDANTYPSSNDAFVQFVSAPGSALLYSDYIGGGGNEATAELVTDRFGAAWVIGNTTPVYQGSGVGPKAPVGVPPYVTNDAFKDFADSGSTDGWAIKLRVGLPILSSVVFTPNSIAGGLGASTNATVTLRNAAPVGGVTLNATLLNASICSFSNAGSVTTTTVFIPQGATTATVPVFSLPVNTPQTCDMRVVLDNDFKIARVTVNPWLDDFSVSPATLVGGNQVTARVRLFQAAISDTSVTLTTSRPDLVTLPAPAEIIVPAGATTATVPLNTNGVDVDSSGIISGSLLGVTKDASFTLTPARLSGLIFNPGRVQSGEVSNMTVQFDGKTGVARTVNLTQGAGAAGILINGNPLPTTVTIPAQTSSVTVPALAPFVPASTSTTVIATQGAQTVSGTLFVDDIDIASLSITPATDVISGTVLTGKVTLTRPAGLTGFTVNLSSSNPSAGTLSTTVVTVAPGQTTSPDFTFNCAVVPADQVTTISASKTGFTTRSVNVTVRAISINLTLSPNSVLGGAQTSTATATLSAPAPASGLNITFSSANNAVATPQLTTVTIAGGSSSASTTIDTFKVSNDTPVVITAAASPLVSNSKTLTVRAPGVVGFVINPSTVFGSQPATGTVTVEDTAPVGGMTIALSAAPAGFITFPATLTIPEGENTASFPITTIAVNADTTVTMTATGSSTSLNASITLLAPDITSVTFSPNLVKGGLTSTGTVTLGQVAPAGGLVVNITSDIPFIANSTVASVTIPAGSRTANFTVTTNRVSRLIAVGFTATIGLRTGKGYLYVKS